MRKIIHFEIAFLFIISGIDILAQVPYTNAVPLQILMNRVEQTLQDKSIILSDIITLAEQELRRQNIPFTYITPTEESFYPSILISNHEQSNLLLIFPLSNNSLLISTVLYLAKMSNIFPIDVLLLAPYNNRNSQIEQVTSFLAQRRRTVLWFDKNMTNSDLVSFGATNKHPPPLFLNKLLITHIRNINIRVHKPLMQHSSILNYSVHDIPIEQLLEHNIPTCYLASEGTSRIVPTTWIYALSQAMAAITIELEHMYPIQHNSRNWEKNYLSWNIPGKTIFISERFLIIFFILLMTTTLFYGLFFRSVLGVYISRIIRHWFVIVCILLIALTINAASSLIVWFFVSILGQDLLFERWIIFLKLALAFFLFSVLYQQLARTPAFWAKNRYLSATALFLLLILVFIAGSQSLSLSFYVGISFMMVFFFSISRTTRMKWIFLILSAIPLFYALYSIITIPSRIIISFLLYDPVYGNIIWTILLLPYILMLVRIDHLSRRKQQNTSSSIQERFSLSLVCIVTFLLPFFDTPRVPIDFTELIDMENKTRFLLIDSKTNLSGTFDFSLAGKKFTAPIKSETYNITLPYYEPKLQSSLQQRKMGTMYQYLYHIISPDETAHYYTVTNSLPAPLYFILRYASLPGADTVGQLVTESNITLGMYPPRNITLECRIESNRPPESIITAIYETLSEELILSSQEQILAQTVRTVIIKPDS